jgi:hypothetical protein
MAQRRTGARLEELIAQDENLRASIERRGRSPTWHPLARDGHSSTPDPNLIRQLADLCRHHLSSLDANAIDFDLLRPESGEAYVPHTMPMHTDKADALGVSWSVRAVPESTIYASDEAVTALATSLRSLTEIWARRSGMTSGQVHDLLRRLDKWTSRVVRSVRRAPRRIARKKKALVPRLAELLRREVPRLRKGEADRLALTIAQHAGAERRPKTVDADPHERLKKRRARAGRGQKSTRTT